MGSTKQLPGVPKADGTTSTNYGPPFEISSTAIYVLRLCKLAKDFKVWMNNTDYDPWDDVVAKVDDKIVCVQLKHNVKLDKNKLEEYLENRKSIINKHPSEKGNIVFVYFTTTPDDAIRTKYPRASTIPSQLSLLLTNKASVYYDDENIEYGDTYFCMNQRNVSNQDLDIKQALAECIGQQYLSEDHLKDIRTKFLEYLRKRYFRLIKGSDPLTREEICQQVGYAMLNKYRIDFKQTDVTIQLPNLFKQLLDESRVIVFNHRINSPFQDHIWQYIMVYLNNKVKQSKLDDLWSKGKFHMPIISVDKSTDKIIWRALEISNFEPKVLILRQRPFIIKEGQTVVTLLENLDVSDVELKLQTGNDEETFKYSILDFNNLKNDKNIKLHQDAFCSIAKEFSKLNVFPNSVVEAHDEFSYVNDILAINNVEETAPLFSAIRVKDVDIKIIEKLINLGANVNTNIIGGHRPIAYAIEENRADIVELLLKNNANPDPADKYGMRPLFYSCLQNKTDIVELLVKYKADCNNSDVNGVRPLFMAYKVKNYDIIRILLNNCERPQAANTEGINILHKVAEDGDIECLNCFIECCPNLNIFMNGDVDGKTPLNYAEDKGHDEFAEILRNALKNK